MQVNLIVIFNVVNICIMILASIERFLIADSALDSFCWAFVTSCVMLQNQGTRAIYIPTIFAFFQIKFSRKEMKNNNSRTNKINCARLEITDARKGNQSVEFYFFPFFKIDYVGEVLPFHFIKVLEYYVTY